MSINFTENNVSRWVNYSSYDWDSYRYFYIALITLDTTIAVVGTLVNLWFIAALLLSPEIRARIRNKIICSMLAVHLTESVIICPLLIGRYAEILLDVYHRFDCSIESITSNIYHIQDFLGNWYLVILLCIYTAQVVNFEPKFTPRWIQISTVAVFISPCVIALLFVPLTMKRYNREYDDSCIRTTYESLKVFKSFGTIVPQAVACLLLLVTSVLKCRRYPQGRSSDPLRAQLIDDGSQIDPLYTFVAILVVAVASDFCLMLFSMNLLLFSELGYKTLTNFYIAFTVLAYLRIIIMPFVFLLFPDIRERIKTWRPWCRSALRADLVVTYEKNSSGKSEISLFGKTLVVSEKTQDLNALYLSVLTKVKIISPSVFLKEQVFFNNGREGELV